MSLEQLAPSGATAAAYSEKRWGGPTRLVPTPLVAVALTATRILQANPRRMAYTATNPGQGSLYIGWDGTLTALSGILVPTLGGSVSLNIDEDGEWCTYELWAIAIQANTFISTWEMIRK